MLCLAGTLVGGWEHCADVLGPLCVSMLLYDCMYRLHYTHSLIHKVLHVSSSRYNSCFSIVYCSHACTYMYIRYVIRTK